jgi:2-oxoglutarate ferredoxin oxidoreductase subunit gamma
MEKFEKAVKPGGLLMYEESAIISPPTRTDIEIMAVPANEEALKLNLKRAANMILVGAFLEKRPLVKIENILNALKKVLPERHHHLIPINKDALQKGKELANEAVKV